MGVVYHTHYLDWFEEARTEALRDLGLPYADLESDGVIMPVVDLAFRYHLPARYDDLVEIVTRMEDRVPQTRVRFDYLARRQSTQEPLVSGHVTLCFFDPDRGRPIRAPARVVRVLESAFHE
jgi:acyl-CoA thioester hydrolase